MLDKALKPPQQLPPTEIRDRKMVVCFGPVVVEKNQRWYVKRS